MENRVRAALQRNVNVFAHHVLRCDEFDEGIRQQVGLDRGNPKTLRPPDLYELPQQHEKAAVLSPIVPDIYAGEDDLTIAPADKF
jgi:hypothetical protein